MKQEEKKKGLEAGSGLLDGPAPWRVRAQELADRDVAVEFGNTEVDVPTNEDLSSGASRPGADWSGCGDR